jgi:hypothetical protein
VHPCTTSGDPRDNAIDLGYSSGRFKDLYLSGGVYLGGTGSANYLDDYESGTFTATSPHVTITNNSTCRYIKVGNLVYATYDITFPSSASGTGVVVNTPFVAQDYGSGMMGWKNMSTDIGIHIYSTGIGFRKMDTSHDATYNDVSTARFIFTAIFSVA